MNILGQIPRYAKVLGLGVESGQAASRANAFNRAGAVAGESAAGRAAGTNAFAHATSSGIESGRIAETAKRFGNYQGLPSDRVSRLAGIGQNIGEFTAPVATPLMAGAKTAGRLSMAAMNNPIGMTAIGIAPFMFMGAAPPPEEGAAMPPDGVMLPPQPGEPPPQGMPIGGLDEEQVRRAKKRAEENAMLNQFYAQQLQQYGGQQ